ncbi:MAG: hypothetical protein IMW98_10530 [Firmicutes bacterium]|nr:hypothetical protein [Bacillota bacterium]
MTNSLLFEDTIAALAGALQRGANDGDHRPLKMTDEEACEAARALLRDLLTMAEYPRILDRHGLRFVLYLENEWEKESPAVIHVQRWDDTQWRNVEEIRAGRC